jgi:hypothetical protein
MGGGSSVPVASPAAARSALHELAGKKLLQCPSLACIQHPTTGDRWVLMVFAPASFFGLIFVARNMATRQLLAKEFTDAELVKEKERQGIVLSWNVFFKAIATDMAAAGGNEGAVWSFTVSGTLAIAIKIQLAGVAPAPKARPPDVFRCEMLPVDASPQNVFRYFIEPLGTFACKRRTDVVDRSDPAKERFYGQCEAAAIIKSNAAQAAERRIQSHLAQIRDLRLEVHRLRGERRRAAAAAVAQSLLLRGVQLSAADSAAALAVVTMPPEEYQDPLLLDAPAAVAARDRPSPPPLFPTLPADGYQDLPTAETSAVAAARGECESPAAVAYYIVHRFIPRDSQTTTLRLHDEGLFHLLCSMEGYATSHKWFSAKRVAYLLRMLLFELASSDDAKEINECVGSALPCESVLALVLSVMCVGLHRHRLTNELCFAENEHYLSSLYPAHPMAYHACAVMLSLAAKQRLCGSIVWELLPTIVQLVALVDDAEHDVGAKGLKDIFLRCLSSHTSGPADVRTTWVMAEAAYANEISSSLSLQGLPSCSSMTVTHSRLVAPQFTVVHSEI